MVFRIGKPPQPTLSTLTMLNKILYNAGKILLSSILTKIEENIQRNNIRNKIGIRTKDIQDSLSEIEEIKKSCKKEELNEIIQDTKRNKKRTNMEMI